VKTRWIGRSALLVEAASSPAHSHCALDSLTLAEQIIILDKQRNEIELQPARRGFDANAGMAPLHGPASEASCA
jgi:hypothetical protein